MLHTIVILGADTRHLHHLVQPILHHMVPVLSGQTLLQQTSAGELEAGVFHLAVVDEQIHAAAVAEGVACEDSEDFIRVVVVD